MALINDIDNSRPQVFRKPEQIQKPKSQPEALRGPTLVTRPIQAKHFKKTLEAPKKHVSRASQIFQAIVIIILANALGLGISSLVIGEIAIGIYAIIAWLFKISSRTSFGIALFAFAMIILLQIIRPESELSSNFAVYTFLLLAVGTVSVCFEVRQGAKWEKWRRNH